MGDPATSLTEPELVRLVMDREYLMERSCLCNVILIIIYKLLAVNTPGYFWW